MRSGRYGWWRRWITGCIPYFGRLATDRAYIKEEEALRAADVIDSIGTLWRATWQGDKVAIALAGLHAGRMIGFQQYEIALKRGSKDGGNTRGRQKEHAFIRVRTWLYPLLYTTYCQLVGQGVRRPGWTKLKLAIDKSIRDGDPFKKKVRSELTLCRYNAWRHAGRPSS